MEGEKYITISQVPQRVHETLLLLQSSINNVLLRENPRSLACNLYDSFNSRLGWINQRLNRSLVAACFDPRYIVCFLISMILFVNNVGDKLKMKYVLLKMILQALLKL
jgi:hypothetical protein